MLTNIIKADIVRSGHKVNDLLPELEKRGFCIGAPRLSRILNNSIPETDTTEKIAAAVEEIVKIWQK